MARAVRPRPHNGRRRGRGIGFSWSLRRVGHAAFVLGGVAVAAWLSLAVTIASISADKAPELALSWWSPNATARANLAARLLEAQAPSANKGRARELAQAALRREPVNPVAARVLGLLAAMDRNERAASALFAYSESISRRDVPTQLWMIEANVSRNDIEAALLHYDRALRTSINSRALLIPILVQASADPAIAAPLARRVATRPPWWRDFAAALAQSSPSSVTLAGIIQRLHLDPGNEVDREFLEGALGRLMRLGDYGRAFEVYRRATGQMNVRSDAVRNGDFESADSLSPFDWTLADQSGLAAVRQPRNGAGGDQALFIFSRGLAGEAARQLLLLPPGRYLLHAIVGGTTDDLASRPTLVLTCERQGPRQTLVAARFPAAATRGANLLNGPIVIPADCPAQWLTIITGTSFDQTAGTPWIDSLSMERLR